MINHVQAPAASLVIDKDVFRRSFPSAPFTIGHALTDHPLLRLEALVEAAAELPSGNLEYNPGDLEISHDLTARPDNGLSALETIRRIEECRSWMALRDVQHLPRYHDLLRELLSEVEPLAVPAVGPMNWLQAFIFVTSPGSMTPYHLDNEHNFLLQIRGSKDVYLYDGEDRAIVPEESLEAFYARGEREIEFHEEHRRAEHHTLLTPGMGLHFPICWPHYVVCGPDVSISLSITWRSPLCDRRKRLYSYNARLREQGRIPQPVGENPRLDSVRDFRIRLQNKLRRATGGE